MNCRDFIIEFEERNNVLSAIAASHLNDCADCRKSSNVQARLWQAIEAFEMINAPEDFDFRVKARIANAKQREFRPQFFPFLRYVLGLSFVALILTFVVFNGFYSPDEKSVPIVAEMKPQSPIQEPNPIIAKPAETNRLDSATIPQPLHSNDLIAATAEKPKAAKIENTKEPKTFANDKNRFVAFNKSVKTAQQKAVKDNQESFKGSHDLASSENLAPIMPKGINSKETLKTAPDNVESEANTITASQILALLGIETESINGALKVKMIKQNSVAERSDVKVGDFVEAIDGEKLTNEPFQAKTFAGKNLTVRRGAETLEIPLHN